MFVDLQKNIHLLTLSLFIIFRMVTDSSAPPSCVTCSQHWAKNSLMRRLNSSWLVSKSQFRYPPPLYTLGTEKSYHSMLLIQIHSLKVRRIDNFFSSDYWSLSGSNLYKENNSSKIKILQLPMLMLFSTSHIAPTCYSWYLTKYF
jgi:hypothetical protein